MTAFHIIRKRLLSLVFVVIGVSIITFIVSNLIPGDPARLVAGERATDEIVQAMRAKLGLDLPLYEQYWRYFKGLLQGDLGTSIRTGRIGRASCRERVDSWGAGGAVQNEGYRPEAARCG